MKKISLSVMAVLAIGLFSCQKEMPEEGNVKQEQSSFNQRLNEFGLLDVHPILSKEEAARFEAKLREEKHEAGRLRLDIDCRNYSLIGEVVERNPQPGNNKTYYLSLYDQNGPVGTTPFTSPNPNFHLSTTNLPAGLYFVAGTVKYNGDPTTYFTYRTPVVHWDGVNNWTHAGTDVRGWHIGDFNGDGRDDAFRYQSGVSGAQVYLSNGSSFTGGSSWTSKGNGDHGWYIGDFNGDNKDDIFRYVSGITGADVLISNGSSFANPVSWTSNGSGSENWYVGDFNGDNRDDIFRYVAGTSGAQVLLSSGSSFGSPASWTTKGNGSQGWYVGDFNGDGRDDILRHINGASTGDVLLSSGSSFGSPVSWTTADNNGKWYVEDFNGDGRDDIARYTTDEKFQVLLSTGSGFSSPVTWASGLKGDRDWYVGKFTNDSKADLFRYISCHTGADMFTSTGTSFSH